MDVIEGELTVSLSPGAVHLPGHIYLHACRGMTLVDWRGLCGAIGEPLVHRAAERRRQQGADQEESDAERAWVDLLPLMRRKDGCRLA